MAVWSDRAAREIAAERAAEAAEQAALDAWVNSKLPAPEPQPGPLRTLSLTCVLCGSHRFRAIPEGEQCVCGAITGESGPADLDHFTELDALRREDEACLRDMEADWTGGLRREQGAL